MIFNAFFTISGLTVQTGGCGKDDLFRFSFNELVCNGLDASTKSPKLDITVERNRRFLILRVRDYGRGISEEVLRGILDYSKSVSSKYHYRRPTRGYLGNALKCIFAIPYALARYFGEKLPDYPIRIKSQNKEYHIGFKVDWEKQKFRLKELVIRKIEFQGTEIAIFFPSKTPNTRVLDLVIDHMILNPNLEITFRDSNINFHIKPVGKIKPMDSRTNIYYYSFQEFRELLEADARNGMLLKDFIKQFRGLSAYETVTLIIKNSFKDDPPKTLTEFVKDNNKILTLYRVMKTFSPKPSTDSLKEIGKSRLKRRLIQIYGENMFWYSNRKGVIRIGDCIIPYVIEAALSLTKNIEGRSHIGFNFSPCLNPSGFINQGFIVEWLDSKGRKAPGLSEAEKRKLRLGDNIAVPHEVLKAYEVSKDRDINLIIHIVCPCLKYADYGKTKFSDDHVTWALMREICKALVDICLRYRNYKKRKQSLHEKRIKRLRISQAKRLLLEEIMRREAFIDNVPTNERTTLQGIFYKIRGQMGGVLGIKRKTFIKWINEICIKRGGDLSYRYRLGIQAAERAQLYYRGKVYDVSLDRIPELAEMGCDIIIVEKEGVCEVLEPYASKRGVALLNSRGFIVDYAEKVIELSKRMRGNLHFFSDFDSSGLYMWCKLREKIEIPRIGVDPLMAERLGLDWEALQEDYGQEGKTPQHWKALKKMEPALAKMVKRKRVEIDSILAEVGPERLWKCLEERMMKIHPVRDYTRSIDFSIKLPEEVMNPIQEILRHIESFGKRKQQELMKQMKEWKHGFVNVDEEETKIQIEIQKEILRHREINRIIKELNALCQKIKSDRI